MIKTIYRLELFFYLPISISGERQAILADNIESNFFDICQNNGCFNLMFQTPSPCSDFGMFAESEDLQKISIVEKILTKLIENNRGILE